MNHEQFIADIEQTFIDALEIVKKKNKDYGSDTDAFKNFMASSAIGIRPEHAILVRIMDKITRITNLLDKSPDVVDEKIEDTLLDLINYGAILKAYIKNTNL